MSGKPCYSKYVVSSSAAAFMLALLSLPSGGLAGPLCGSLDSSTVGDSTPGAVFLSRESIRTILH